ncbi:MAG: type II CAAX endopeptidase family protein [Pseudomonadota bacterium]
MSILVVIGAWFAMGTAYGALIGDVFIGGYEVKFSVLISLILTAAVVYWVKKTRGSLASLGFKRPQSWWRSGLVAIGMVIAIYASITAIMTGLSAIGMMPAAPQDPSGMLVQGPSLAISLTFSLALMWACAAFGEELLFRGYLQSNLERALGGENWRNGLVAALVVSLSFGAMHVPSQGMYGLIVTGVVGFLLGLFYLAGKRSLFRVVMAHGLINTTSFALFAASA